MSASRLTPDRILEALLLLQAVDEASEPISVERIKDGWLIVVVGALGALVMLGGGA